jgi:hypothetical protein
MLGLLKIVGRLPTEFSVFDDLKLIADNIAILQPSADDYIKLKLLKLLKD